MVLPPVLSGKCRLVIRTSTLPPATSSAVIVLQTQQPRPLLPIPVTPFKFGGRMKVAAMEPGSTTLVCLIYLYISLPILKYTYICTGPILTYLASCGGDCSSFVPSSSTAWFKISELGKTSTTANEWVQGNLNSGAPVNLTIPSNLAAGNYLMRHEIIALQNAMTQGLAEFYTSCAQLSIGGSQSGKPGSTVNFPGAYSATDPGILINVSIRDVLSMCALNDSD